MHAAMRREVEQLLDREAWWLDEWLFHAWLDLCTDDVRYWMPVRSDMDLSMAMYTYPGELVHL